MQLRPITLSTNAEIPPPHPVLAPTLEHVGEIFGANLSEIGLGHLFSRLGRIFQFWQIQNLDFERMAHPRVKSLTNSLKSETLNWR